MGPASQYSYLRATRTRVDADTIHTAPRETHIKNVLHILGLGDNECKSMPTPTVQTCQNCDEDEPRLGEEDRRACHRCVGVLMHLFKYRPDIAFCSPRGQQDARIARRCRPPKIATTWQVSLGDTEAWNHDTDRATTLNILMRTQMQIGVEIQPTERVPQVEYSRQGQQHCESSRRVRVVQRDRAERASTTLR